MDRSASQRLHQLEMENRRLKQAVADLTMRGRSASTVKIVVFVANGSSAGTARDPSSPGDLWRKQTSPEDAAAPTG